MATWAPVGANEMDDHRSNEGRSINLENCAKEPLVLVHLGRKVPKYALSNFRSTADRLLGERQVIVLSDTEISPAPNLSRVFVSSDWYSRTSFERFIRTLGIDVSFRDGLWSHSIERFFVLSQFARKNLQSGFYHAENDVVVLGLSELDRALESREEEVFFCRDSEERATAALAYFDSAESVQHLVSWLEESVSSQQNEMEMLADYLDQYPVQATSFPTLNQVDKSYVPPWASLPISIGGVADAAALGQWLAGKDPRNSFGISWSRFRNETVRIDLSRLSAQILGRHRALSISYNNTDRLTVFALHIHSKSIPLFRMGVMMRLVLWASNNRLVIPTAWSLKDNHLLHFVWRIGRKATQVLRKFGSIVSSQINRRWS